MSTVDLTPVLSTLTALVVAAEIRPQHERPVAAPTGGMIAAGAETIHWLEGQVSADYLAEAVWTAMQGAGNQTVPSHATYQHAIRRKGEDLIQAGGPEALSKAAAFIRDQAPAKADRREAILREAWAGLEGWRS